MKPSSDTPFQLENPHALPASEVLQKLDCHADGLSADEAAKRLESVGPNLLPVAAKEGLLKRFFKHFHDLLIYILIGAAVVTALMGHWIDTGVIMAVVVINAIIGFVQANVGNDELRPRLVAEVQRLATGPRLSHDIAGAFFADDVSEQFSDRYVMVDPNLRPNPGAIKLRWWDLD